MINQEKLDTAQLRLTILTDHRACRRIIETLDWAAPINVTDLTEELNIAQSSCSRHLGELRQIGLVVYHKEGKEHIYNLRRFRIEKFNNVIKNFSNGINNG